MPELCFSTTLRDGRGRAGPMAAELVSGPRVHGAVLLTRVFVSIFREKHFQAVGEWVFLSSSLCVENQSPSGPSPSPPYDDLPRPDKGPRALLKASQAQVAQGRRGWTQAPQPPGWQLSDGRICLGSRKRLVLDKEIASECRAPGPRSSPLLI